MRMPIPFLGDPSATVATEWKKIPDHTRVIAIGVGTLATGTPVGAFTVEVSNHGKAGVSGVAPYDVVTLTTLTIAAVNGASRQLIDRIGTGAACIRLVYTRTSGGEGGAFTDDSGNAGTDPTVSFVG